MKSLIHTMRNEPYTAKVKQSLCCFEKSSETVLQAQPQHLFKPMGLMLWDVPDSARIMATIGTEFQNVVTYNFVPCRWFSHWKSFSEIMRALADGLEPPGWGSWSTVNVGQIIRLSFSKPVPNVQAVMWGHTAE